MWSETVRGASTGNLRDDDEDCGLLDEGSDLVLLCSCLDVEDAEIFDGFDVGFDGGCVEDFDDED